MVVPRRHQLGRRDVVVVDDEGLGRGRRATAPSPTPWRTGRRRRRPAGPPRGRRGRARSPPRCPPPRCRRRCRSRSRGRGRRRAGGGCGARPRRHGAGRGRSGGCRSRGGGGGEGEPPVVRLALAPQERRHLDEAGPVKRSSHVASWSDRPSTRSCACTSRVARRPRAPRTTTTSGASRARVRRHWSSSGRSACSGRRSTTPLSTMPPSVSVGAAREVLGRLGDRHGAAALERAAGPPHPAAPPRARRRRGRRARRAGRPPRSRRARGRLPACAPARAPPPARPRRRARGPGTSHAAPSTGRSCAASRASSVCTRADRKRKASTTWPIASSSSVLSPSAAPARRSRPPRRRSSRPGRRAAGAALGLELVGQGRGAGVVRAVAVAEMREGGERNSTRRSPGAPAARRPRAAPRPPGRGSVALRPPPPSDVRPGPHRRLGERVRARRWMLPALPPLRLRRARHRAGRATTFGRLRER